MGDPAGHAFGRSAYWIATLTALVGAAVLIYWDWTARPLWVDEEMILLNVRDHALGRLAGPLWLDQSAPLGWLALERLVLLTFGSGERAVRMVNVLFGIGTLVTALWIGRRWMSPVGAAILALLC
jgi:ABC-type Fe3+-siderophore transport system permease subunit